MKSISVFALAAASFAIVACSAQKAQPAQERNAATPAATSAAGDVIASATTTSAQPSMASASDAGLSAADSVVVYKDPNCGCCAKWVDHMRKHGFTVKTMDMPDLSMVKQKYAIGEELQSCHTAIVGKYAFEGHVPADVIVKFLKEKPAVAGLAVPGMPQGSPGMEGAIKEKYDILTFDRAGRTTVYAQR